MNAKKCKLIRKVTKSWREAEYNHPVVDAEWKFSQIMRGWWKAEQVIPALPDEHSIPVYKAELGKNGLPTGGLVVSHRKACETRLVNCGKALYRELKRSFA